MEQRVYTSCTLDCPDGCGIIAHVKDGRLVKLEGYPDHEFTQGYLCGKTYHYPDRVYSHERILHPLCRTNGRTDAAWQRVSWDEALDLVAAKIRHFVETFGPLSIMHYQRTGSWGATKILGRRFWNLLGGVTTSSGSLCSGAARAGQALDFGTRNGHDPSDFLNSRAVFLWGRNPIATNLHVVPILKEVRRRGGEVVLIDPVKSESAGLATRHVRPRVASDAHLAMAMAKIILGEGFADDEFVGRYTDGFAEYKAFLDAHELEALCRTCDLPETEVRELARLYATTKPASILLGWGLNKYKHSAEIFRCVDALAALCGNIGVPGGGATHGYNTQRHFDKSVEASERARHRRTIPEPLLGRRLGETRDPAVRMMYVNSGNPVNQSPNSNLVAHAFAGLDFVVVVDQFLTDTSDHAHVFLPSTTFLEEEDMLVSWGHNIIGGVNRAIEPVGEARSDLWIFQQLAERLGFGAEMAGTPREWLKRIFAPLEAEGVSVEQVMERPVRCPVAPLVPFADHVFPTKSGRFEFIRSMQYEERVTPEFPLVLVTNFSKRWLLSQMLEKDHPKVAWVRVGVETARQQRIENGQKALLRSPVGCLEIEVIVDPRVGAGTVVMPVGTWMKRGGGANVLTEDLVSNFGEMAAYGETRVRLEPIVSTSSPGSAAAGASATC